MAKRVLVCGGRNYDNREHVWGTLDRLNLARGPFEMIIHGMQSGADAQADDWCSARLKCEAETYEPDWKRWGRAAGPIRNQGMMDDAHPDLVVAFPGGRGTADMIRRARKFGIEVIQIAPVQS